MNSQDLAIQLYQNIADQDVEREMTRWHASSLSQCPRTQFLRRTGVHRLFKPTGAKVLRWQAGHAIEQTIRPYLVALMPNLMSNQRLESDTLDLTGEYDNYDPDSQFLWEIKSVSSHAVKYKKVADDRHHLRDEKPYLHHVWQQHAYVLLMREQGIEVKGIGFLYITLDGLIVPYSMPVDDLILANVEQRIAGLNAFWERQQVPPCICADQEHQFYKPVMQYCDYKTEEGCCDLNLTKIKEIV